MTKHIDTLRRLNSFKRLDNNKGTVMVVSYLILTVLFTLTTGLAITNTTELRHAQRFQAATQAFWAAEAALNRFMQDTSLLDGGNQTITFGTHTVTLSKDDTNPQFRLVLASANVKGVVRELEMEFPATPPSIFENTMSSGGNINLNAVLTGVDVNDKTRLTGSFNKSGFLAWSDFEDKVEGVSSSTTTLTYPDTDNNGTADEFNDFVAYNQNLISVYEPSEVVYITSDSTVSVWPSSSLVDKKIIYVEGSSAGSGDVDLYFDPTWAADQNLTVISTGSVNYIQPLQNPSAGSQLNTISWDDYNEGAILLSTHDGVSYAHDEANFSSIVSLSDTDGVLIANSNIDLNLAIAAKRFDWEDPVDGEGLVPPGFEGLVSGGGSGYSSTPTRWSEL